MPKGLAFCKTQPQIRQITAAAAMRVRTGHGGALLDGVCGHDMRHAHELVHRVLTRWPSVTLDQKGIGENHV
jgi:hypothetical protein